ncbi:hypothetical protein TRVA0_051S00210 [Trichomonascus vanleenenianus]|uniref:lysophosphatidic acid acyltransferase LOA1 n=1 Tax=Trichomonascus vanleenenianus TaxID=2268995 RepID=UPI003EC9AC6F
MEKFSQWRDGATGIAPFLPAVKAYSYESSNFLIAAEIVLANTIRALKVPVLILILALHLAVFQWIPALSQKSLKLLLLIAGVYWTPISSEDARRGIKTILHPSSGDVIVSNFTSPLDPLLYGSFMKAIFVVPRPGSKLYRPLSAFEAMRRAMSLPPALKDSGEEDENEEELVKILVRAKSQGAVVVIFPESTTSNGRGLLPISTMPISSLPQTSRIYPAALKYSPAASCVTPLPTNVFSWGWRLIGEITGVTAYIKFGNQMMIPQAPDETVTKEVVDNICKAGRLRRVGENLDVDAKREFVAAWNRNRKKLK